ncbi:unnamed protein product [Wickerhamomyces anomalus]
MADTSQPSISQLLMQSSTERQPEDVVELLSSQPKEEVNIEPVVPDARAKSPTKLPEYIQAAPAITPSKVPIQIINPVTASSGDAKSPAPTTPAKTPKQKQKEEEKLQKMKQRELEKQEREKAKEEERLLKEKLRKEKEEERKRINDEKERIKKEKREKLLEEKKERDRKKEEERLKKEEEKQKKLDEKRKAEEQKKKEEEAKQKKATKLQISNFFKAKTTLKNFDEQLKTSKGQGLKEWFKQRENSNVQESTTAKYIFTHQLDAAPLNFKFIRFYENIKTYIGTYTKDPTTGISIDPFILTDAFIDWDEEENENEEGEGEDIDDEDDEEEEDEDMGDLSDFLDEDGEENKNKKKTLGPLIPQIHWKDITEYSIEVLKPDLVTINPFEDYWKTTDTKDSGLPGDQDQSPKPKKSKSLITSRDDLEKFAKQVHDSDFTVPTMVELLKKQLPTYTKLTIENTLKNYAKKVGPKATEKKWEVDTELLKKAMEL